MANFAAAFDLSTLDGANGFRIDGVDVDDRSGRSVSSAGDVNGDGYDDIIVGASNADPNGDSYAGESYVIFGSGAGFAAGIDLAALDGSNGFRIDGIDANDASGRSVSAAGDVNGDGFDDIIVGAPHADSYAGESYVIFGSGAVFAAGVDLAALDGTDGFRIDGIDALDRSGLSASSAGDVNGDGYDDIIVGAYGGAPNDDAFAGESYVIFGSGAIFAAVDLAALDGTNGFRIDGIDVDDRSGSSVASAGDVNGDGFDDIIVGAFHGDPNGDSEAGESYVIFGSGAAFAASFDLASLGGVNGFRIDGIDAFDYGGFSVASAGDVNGDGFDDIVVGAYGADPGGDSYAGQSYVIFGSDGIFAPSLDLAALDGTNGFRIDGIDGYDFSGYSVSSAGDINGDGFDDIVIGAFGGDVAAGESYVAFGKAGGFAPSLDLGVLDGSNGFRLDGIDSGDSTGISVSSAGDVNGDGFDDIVIGAPGGDPNGVYNAGESYVVFGSGAGDFPAVLSLDGLGAASGSVFYGDADYDRVGRAVASAGDVNGDGFDDIILGAGGAEPYGEYEQGASYVVFGSVDGFAPLIDPADFDGTNGFRLVGVAQYDEAGYSVASAGDINGDGYDDVIVGAFEADPNGADGAGSSYVIFGAAGGFDASIDLASLDGSNGFRLDGGAAGDRSGRSVALAGDVNGDGLDDLVVGASNADPGGTSGAGSSYVVFGSLAGFDASLDLAGLDGANGFRLDGVAGGDNSGRSVSSAGDVNGDGVDDILIAAPWANPNGVSYAGSTYVVFGSDAGFAPSIDLEQLDGTDGFRIDGFDIEDNSGHSVAGAGDFNGDGFDDIVIGAREADPSGRLYAGESYIVFGSGAAFAESISLGDLDGTNGFAIPGLAEYDSSGVSVAGAGDVNGDGFDDVIIGAYEADPGGVERAGSSYVIFGSAAGFTPEFDLASLDGTNGFRIDGAAESDFAGQAVAAAGDVNGDGFDDILVGAPGRDGFANGAGETYIIYGRAPTTAVSREGAGGDQVIRGGSFNDTLAGLGGADTLAGGGGDDSLVGGEGDDRLRGDGGLDTMEGGAGDDTYLVDDAGDVVIEAAGGGDDRVIARVDFDAGGEEIETIAARRDADGLSLKAGSVAARVRGAGGADTLAGGAEGDTLIGAGGDDRLIMGRGGDALKGGGGADSFVLTDDFPGERAMILDFVSGSDRIEIDADDFGGALTAGPLALEAFRANGTGRAEDADDRFIYDSDSGKLFYDSDGSGAGDGVQIARFTGAPTLTAGDFAIVGGAAPAPGHALPFGAPEIRGTDLLIA